jgi:hypothetical protein
MKEYTVYDENGNAVSVEADECSVEDGGVLVFYRDSMTISTNSEMHKAFFTWSRVEREDSLV